MDIMTLIAEDKIKQAIKDGELNNLPGQGKPLNLKDDLPGMPQEIKMAYRIMKNAGYVTEEAELKKERVTVEDLIGLCENDKEKISWQKKLTQKRLQFSEMMKKRKGVSRPDFGEYEEKILKKFE